jgi:MarR family transcriptional regulator, lower aerobic nicotinate degradation pathway regulator
LPEPSHSCDVDKEDGRAYVLDDQIGFILRQVYQRHAALFAERFGDDMTPMQWAAIAKLAEVGDCSQNLLGRLTAMDVATIKGVVERLIRRALVDTKPDPTDRRRIVVSLTQSGREAYDRKADMAVRISAETLAPLTPEEQATLIRLLGRLR